MDTEDFSVKDPIKKVNYRSELGILLVMLLIAYWLFVLIAHMCGMVLPSILITIAFSTFGITVLLLLFAASISDGGSF